MVLLCACRTVCGCMLQLNCTLGIVDKSTDASDPITVVHSVTHYKYLLFAKR